MFSSELTASWVLHLITAAVKRFNKFSLREISATISNYLPKGREEIELVSRMLCSGAQEKIGSQITVHKGVFSGEAPLGEKRRFPTESFCPLLA